MKNFKIKWLLLSFILSIASINQVWAGASWIGKSYIVVNGIWYNANGTGQSYSFDGYDLGHLTSLTLGGEVQTYGQSDGENNHATMYYQISGQSSSSMTLYWYQYTENNNWFHSASGKNQSFASNTVDISGLTPGEYTLSVWFYQADGKVYDSNNQANYVATFYIDPYITFDQQSGSEGTTNITGTWGAAMPSITLPTYTGKKFEGYYTEANGGGTQYYYYDGSSAHTCDFTSNPTLYANWKTPTEYTFYYAAPSDVVANNTVKCYVNYGYDAGTADVNMTATDKTYNNKRIYSVTVTANYQSFDAIYFKPKGWSGTGSEEQAANTSYVAASTINGKIYEHGVGWQTYAEDASYTVYFVNYNDWTTPKAYAWSSDYDKSVADYASSAAMTKTAYTYNGHDIYSITYTRGFTNVIFNDDASESIKTGTLSLYANRGKLYNGSGWQAYGRDITIYAIPEDTHYGYSPTFDVSNHNLLANVKVGDSEWLGDWPIFTKTSYKYGGNWIYEARILAKYNVIKQLQFHVQKKSDNSAVANYKYDGGNGCGDRCDLDPNATADELDGKIFLGWYTSVHKWNDYGRDITLNRDGGTTGSTSVTATVGAAMPSATMAGGNTGYTFAGYFTEEGGSGTQYYNADGTSANNWSLGDDELYAKWTQNVTLDREGATTGSTSVGVTYKSATFGSITNPEKDNYTFAGWYTGDDGTGELVINTSGVLQENVTDDEEVFTGAGGIWTHTGSAPTLHAKWEEIPYTVTVNVGAGGGGTTNVSSVTDAKVVTGSSTITANPANEGWKFKEWQLGDGVSIKTGSTTSASITVNATQNSSITAVFEPRFALEGSLMDDNAGGMPGWEHVNAADFEVISFTGLGASGVDLRCSRTLEPNKEYKFRIYDRERANRLGVASSDYLLDANSSVELSTVGDESGKNVLINTVGYGTYIFHITQLSATNYYPTIEVIRQTSYQSNFDTYYQDAEGTLSQGTTGGTISVSSSQGGNTYDLTRSGQWVCSGGSITYTATPATGYSFAGWYHSTAYNDWFSNTNPWTDASITTTSAAYAKFVENTDTLKTTGNWSTAGNWSKGSVPTINDVVIINQPVNVDVTTAKAKRIKFGESGSLTIAATGVLEVAGTITNTDASKIVINTTSSSQGALIYDISTAPYATVNMTIPNTDKFHYIASPVGYVPVDPTFAGKDVYTYAWIEGKGWDKRGFYEGFSGDEVILIKGLYGCTFSGQLRPTTGGSISCTATPANANAQGVNMVPNTLTAPIKIAAMDLSAAYEGAVHIWNGSTWNSYAQSSCGDAAVIPALQGYAVLTEDGGTVSFTYDAAVRGASSHNDALRAPQRTNSDIQDHITLSVTTNERKENLLLYENNQFSDAIDKGWEALYMEGDGTYGELYAHAKEPMSILATDSLEGTVLGFVPGQAETYTISFEGDGRGYYLNDVKEEEATLIEEGNTYEFAADAATNATRFVISKTPIKKTPTGVDNTNDGVKARKQLIDGTLYIIRDGRLYNTTGALVK